MAAPPKLTATKKRFTSIVSSLGGKPGVTSPAEPGARKSFGASGLKIHNKVFAMVSSKDEFVVKLPRQRVDELVESGDGTRFDPGHGRVMKEWLTVSPKSKLDWLALATEAMKFVGAT